MFFPLRSRNLDLDDILCLITYLYAVANGNYGDEDETKQLQVTKLYMKIFFILVARKWDKIENQGLADITKGSRRAVVESFNAKQLVICC